MSEQKSDDTVQGFAVQDHEAQEQAGDTSAKVQYSGQVELASDTADAPDEACDEFSATCSFEQESNRRQLIRNVYSRLMSVDGLDFQSLVVRQIDDNSVCLSGIVYVDDESPDIDTIACEVDGIDSVVNRLVVQTALTASG